MNALPLRQLLWEKRFVWHNGPITAVKFSDTNQYSIPEGDLGAVVDTMPGNRVCSVDSCERAAVSNLAQQDFCVNHFVNQCYEQLERVDPWVRKGLVEVWDRDAMKKFVDESAQQVLDISLHCPELSNLEKGRLLDILLWAGDLLSLMYGPTPVFGEISTFRKGRQKAQAAARS